MAQGSVDVDVREKFPSGLIMSAGRLKIGNADTITPGDLGMRLIKSFVVTPWNSTPVGSVTPARVTVATGSIGSLNTLNTGGGSPGSGNFVQIRKWVLDNYGAPGSVTLGTMAIGTTRLSFQAWGY